MQSIQSYLTKLQIMALQENVRFRRLREWLLRLITYPCLFSSGLYRNLNIFLQEIRSLFGRILARHKEQDYLPVTRSYSSCSPIQRQILSSYNQARSACILEMASNRPWATRVDLATFLEGWDMGEKWASHTYNLVSCIGQSAANNQDSYFYDPIRSFDRYAIDPLAMIK